MPQHVRANVYPGVLEQCEDNTVYQYPLVWIYVGKSKVGLTMDILNKMNDEVYMKGVFLTERINGLQRWACL